MIENFLEFRRGFLALAGGKIRETTHINRIQGPVGPLQSTMWQAKFVGRGLLEQLDRRGRLTLVERNQGAQHWQIIESHGSVFREPLFQIVRDNLHLTCLARES